MIFMFILETYSGLLLAKSVHIKSVLLAIAIYCNFWKQWFFLSEHVVDFEILWLISRGLSSEIRVRNKIVT